jgi:hypothetical protein
MALLRPYPDTMHVLFLVTQRPLQTMAPKRIRFTHCKYSPSLMNVA